MVASLQPSFAAEGDLFDLLGEPPGAQSPADQSPAAQPEESDLLEESREPKLLRLPSIEADALAKAFRLDDKPQRDEPLLDEGVRLAAESVQAEPVESEDNDALSRPISRLTLDGEPEQRLVDQMTKIPEDFSIKDRAQQRFGQWDHPEAENRLGLPRFSGTMVTWAAPATFHRPLLFEQPNLERYGHHVRVCQRDNLSQSALSAAHFFATVPVLPYKIGASGGVVNGECDYTLGAYRPGSCNPHQLIKPRCSLRGLACQAAATAGLIYLIP